MFRRFSVVLSAFLSAGLADTLYLRSGTSIQGSFAGGDSRQVRMLIGDRVATYRIEDVGRIEFGESPSPVRDDNGPRIERDAPPPQPPPPPPAADPNPPVVWEIPANTNLVVRMVDNADSERDSVGQTTYRATIDEPISVNGQVVIPRGADATLKLVADEEAGKFTGKTSLTLALMSITVNGRAYNITTSEVTQASSSRTGRTVKTVGGGAVAGAILGGLIGGGKGAVIGATSGGAIGAGAEVFTKGPKVKIPSETRLSFLLTQPIRL